MKCDRILMQLLRILHTQYYYQFKKTDLTVFIRWPDVENTLNNRPFFNNNQGEHLLSGGHKKTPPGIGEVGEFQSSDPAGCCQQRIKY